MYLQAAFSGVEQRPVAWPVVVAVVLVHIAVAMLLIARHPRIEPVLEAPILVSLLPAEQPSASKPLPQAPTSRPVIHPARPAAKPVTKAPEQVVAAAASTSSASAPVPTPMPALPQKSEVPAARAETVPASQPSAQQAVAKPAATEEPDEQPRFDADYLDNPNPGYPALSRKLRESGEVLLRVHVSLDGRPEQVNLHRSSGFERLDERAISTVRQWKFLPARQGGKPVEAWVIVPILFSLKG